ncbi:MAG: DMT family transporter [Anderseniella sp.]
MNKPVEDTGAIAGFGFAVFLLVCGVTTASLSGAFMKILSTDLNTAMLTFGRYSGYLLVILPFSLWKYGRQVFVPPQAQVQFLRAVMILGATFAFIYSIRLLPIATTVAILYVYPFLVALMSPALLGERASSASWAGVTGGFIGILIVMRPDVDAFNAGAIAALVTGAFYALHIILTRKVANAAPALVSNSFMAIVALVLVSPLTYLWWQPVSLQQAGIMLVLGGVNAIAHLLIINAYKLSPAPALAPFTYSEIVATTLWGIAIFGDVPDIVTLVGITIIITSGIMVTQSGRFGRLLAKRRAASGG